MPKSTAILGMILSAIFGATIGAGAMRSFEPAPLASGQPASAAQPATANDCWYHPTNCTKPAPEAAPNSCDAQDEVIQRLQGELDKAKNDNDALRKGIDKSAQEVKFINDFRAEQEIVLYEPAGAEVQLPSYRGIPLGTVQWKNSVLQKSKPRWLVVFDPAMPASHHVYSVPPAQGFAWRVFNGKSGQFGPVLNPTPLQ